MRFKALIIVMLCMLSGVMVSAQGGNEDFCLSKGGVWNTTDSTCEAVTNIEMRVNYPVEFAARNQSIESEVDAFVRDQREALLSMGADTLYPIGRQIEYFLHIDSETFQHSDSIVSVLFTISTYTGGAHPNSFYETMTFDLDGGYELSFSQIFPPETDPLATIVPIVQAALTEKLGPDAPEDMLLAGSSMDSANYQNFVLTPDSVIFYFDPYQVAPYVFGPQQVEIPLSELEDVLAPLS